MIASGIEKTRTSCGFVRGGDSMSLHLGIIVGKLEGYRINENNTKIVVSKVGHTEAHDSRAHSVVAVAVYVVVD